MSLLELSAGSLRAALAPHVGGSLASFSRVFGAARTHAGIDWLRPASPQDLDRLNPLGMASFPLVPFCNRIRNGRASFGGREIRFPRRPRRTPGEKGRSWSHGKRHRKKPGGLVSPGRVKYVAPTQPVSNK